MITSQQISVTTAGGYRIAASLYYPADNARAAVLIVPGMGLHQQYYAALAEWLSAQGLLVATFDYYGTGRSLTTPLSQVACNIVDWARDDCGAMLDTLVERLPGKPLYWLGHSLGGQVLALAPNHARITKAIFITTGTGYWRRNAAPLRRIAWLLWYVIVPPSLPLFGYFPGRRLHMVGDLPRGVMAQWRRWCLHPEYAVGVEGATVGAQYAAVRTPITCFACSDDEFMSTHNLDSLLGFYRNAPKTVQRLMPQDASSKRIGHFGFFKPEMQQTLWQRYLLPELQ